MKNTNATKNFKKIYTNITESRNNSSNTDIN